MGQQSGWGGGGGLGEAEHNQSSSGFIMFILCGLWGKMSLEDVVLLTQWD